MPRLTPEQRLQLVQMYHENHGSVRQTYRSLRPFYQQNNRPSEQLIRRTVARFGSALTLADVADNYRKPRKRRNETIVSIKSKKNKIPEDAIISIRRRAKKLCTTALRKMLSEDLAVTRSYKIQLIQQLKPNDHHLRRMFGEWVENQQKIDPLLHRRIMFSDEAHFWLNGNVTKQNCRIWSEGVPTNSISQQQQKPAKCTVWCAMWSGGIIGPYFFKNESGQHEPMVNGERYRTMIKGFLIPELGNLKNLDQIWFQQDGAKCHTEPETLDLLKQTMDNRVISRNGPVKWPPRSCDLTPMDYFLWGYVKSLVYAEPPSSLSHLEAKIMNVILNIKRTMLEKVMENWTSRIRHVKDSRGGHMPEIIFKQLIKEDEKRDNMDEAPVTLQQLSS